MRSPDPSIEQALQIADDAWQEIQCSPFVQRQLDSLPTRFPDVSLAEAQRRGRLGSSLLQRVASLDLKALPHDLALTLRLVKFRAQTWAREADWYFTVCDPLGVGFFGLFLPTSYCGGFTLSIIHGQLASWPFRTTSDAERYLSIVRDYARFIEQFTERLSDQSRRGILMPKVQVIQARVLLARLKNTVRQTVGVQPQRLAKVGKTEFVREIENCIATSIEPAFDRALAGLSDRYLTAAPDRVGISQYPGGAEVYAELVKLHTTLDLTPQEVHARGLHRMADIERSMSNLRSELGFKGDDAAFMARIHGNPRWRADTAEGVANLFQRYIDRINAKFHDWFLTAPMAKCSVAALPESLEGSMTYGYYDAPRAGRAEGKYFFNARNLTSQPLHTVGALTFHELMPGHHLHFASQQENVALHPIRRYSFVNAYNEGWAEYAATLAGEIGLYQSPEERYGRLAMDAFLTCRLVVDTGMNALGWSLERARDYMRKSSKMAEAEILTESVRYSCDLPGQALAYKLGDAYILALRERMRSALGASFDPRTFHSVVLGPGALPMEDLAWHVDHEVDRLHGRVESRV